MKRKPIHIPKGYYKIAKKMFKNPPELHNIETLRQTLMGIKLPRYSWRKFNCSRCSAYLDWYLRGMGFRTCLATSRFVPHMWLLVYLDGGKKAAIEATLLTSDHYTPPGVIDEPHSRDREFKSSYSLNPLINFLCSILWFFGITDILLFLGLIKGGGHAILQQQKKYYFRPYRKYKSIYTASKYVGGLVL